MKARLPRKKVPSVLGYPTDMMREDLLQHIGKMTRRIMNVVAVAKIPVEEKEELANLFLFILNVLDIENAKIDYEKIRPNTATGGPKTLHKK
jgi:hypothetical protein